MHVRSQKSSRQGSLTTPVVSVNVVSLLLTEHIQHLCPKLRRHTCGGPVSILSSREARVIGTPPPAEMRVEVVIDYTGLCL